MRGGVDVASVGIAIVAGELHEMGVSGEDASASVAVVRGVQCGAELATARRAEHVLRHRVGIVDSDA
jgi:hypothetical protein